MEVVFHTTATIMRGVVLQGPDRVLVIDEEFCLYLGRARPRRRELFGIRSSTICSLLHCRSDHLQSISKSAWLVPGLASTPAPTPAPAHGHGEGGLKSLYTFCRGLRGDRLRLGRHVALHKPSCFVVHTVDALMQCRSWDYTRRMQARRRGSSSNELGVEVIRVHIHSSFDDRLLPMVVRVSPAMTTFVAHRLSTTLEEME